MPELLNGFLARAVQEARVRTALAMEGRPLSVLLREVPADQPPSFAAALAGPGVNIIAEIKYRSPSRGAFVCTTPPDRIARDYASAGAAAISVLTNGPHFGGSLAHLRAAKEAGIPLLRKDFIIDEYQVVEARAAGASSCLFIVAALEPDELRRLIDCARRHEMEPLVEVHRPAEFDTARECGASIIGVNSRDLETLGVDLAVPFAIARRAAGDDVLLVAESGLDRAAQIIELRDAGYRAFLIGGALMSRAEPGEALTHLLEECRVHQDLRHHQSG